MREKHWIFIGNSNDEKLQARAKSFAQEKKSDPLLFSMNAEHISFEDWQDSFTTEVSINDAKVEHKPLDCPA